MNNKDWWKNLQPLRIPPFWELVWNKLDVLEPNNLSEDDPAWQFTLVEDILYMRQKREINKQVQIISIDLGWYPDGDPQGEYRLVAFLNDDIMNPILEFTSRSTQEIVETLEYWLFGCVPYCQLIDEKSFRKRHPNKK